GAQARPNEVTFSEDWMRPDYVPPAAPPSPEPATAPTPQAPLAAEAPIDGSAGSPPTVSTDPAAGLPGMMVPSGAGS
ncbi:MAG TPA: mammalian cell entry protein, partial [Mycobacterium sp.]|nr:mammalian cell entry protein [Mycobacterium sp.]